MTDFIRFAQLIEAQTWTFAKTMPKNPHHYTVRNRWTKDEDFVFVVEYLRTNGYDGYWWKNKYRYFDLNGHTYWTMGSPINNPDGSPLTIIINRKKRYEQKEYMSEYDHITAEYEDFFSKPRFEEETEQVILMLPEITGRVLDIGCGTGTLIDFLPDIKPENYIGLDPSKEMLKAFEAKHPSFAPSLICDRFENFWLGKFDAAVALFGTASYINPEKLCRVFEMMNDGGKVFLMFYADDYDPVTHQQFNIHPHIYRGAQNSMPGTLSRFGSYDILTNYELLLEDKRIRAGVEQDSIPVR